MLQQGPAVPARGDAAGVLGGPGQGAVELHQPAPARRGRGPGRERRSSRPEEFDQLAEIRLWAGQDAATAAAPTSTSGRLPAVWDAVASENGNCLGRKCPRHKDCFYFKARRRMWSANILVVNHALFMSDLALRGRGRRPPARVRRRHLRRGPHARGRRRRAPGLAGLERAVRVHADPALQRPDATRACSPSTSSNEAIEQVQRVRYAAARLLRRRRRLAGRHGPANGRLRKPLGWPDTLGEELRKLATAIGQGAETIEERGAADRADRRAGALRGAGGRRSRPGSRRTSPESVYWIEVERTDRAGGSPWPRAPLDVGPTLRRDAVRPGADLRPDLGHALRRLAAPVRLPQGPARPDAVRDAASSAARSTTPSQVTIHLPAEPARPLRQTRRVRAARRSGRSRTTSRRRTARRSSCSPRTRCSRPPRGARPPGSPERNIALFAQSDGMPRSKMVEAFKADVNSVIFGADSFWQGVDVPGEALSNVIIVRLPFSVPEPPAARGPARRRSASAAATRSSSTRCPRPSSSSSRASAG